MSIVKAGAAPVPGTAALTLSRRNLIRGILAVIAAGFLFTTSHAVIKLQAGDFGIFQLMFFRSFFAFIPLAPLLFRDGIASLRTRRPGLHAIRSICGLVSMLGFLYALGFLELADITAINFTMPLFVTALSVPLLGEQVGWRRWTAVVVGFTGVLLIVRPDRSILDAANLIALFGAFLYAVAVICMRRLGTTERSATTAFFFQAACALVGAIGMIFEWRTPEGVEWVFLIMIGILGGIAQLLMTAAYRLAPAAVAAPFDYTALIWAAGLGYLLWGDVPTREVATGAALIVGSGLFIFYREAVLFGLWRRLPAIKPSRPSA